MRLGRGREGNIASGRRSLHTHFQFLDLPKYDYNDLEKAMIQGFAWHYLVILYFLAYPKFELL